MILRRVVEHLRKQHWTSVFIELLIVVFGVYLGLQAQEWSKGLDATLRPSGRPTTRRVADS